VLALSPKGFEIYDVVAPMVLESERRLLAALDPDQRGQLDALLAKLASGVDSISD
jgi:DNA-binding MarR family transcriptional regulator